LIIASAKADCECRQRTALGLGFLTGKTTTMKYFIEFSQFSVEEDAVIGTLRMLGKQLAMQIRKARSLPHWCVVWADTAVGFSGA
jgi:hypothetical protein